MRKYPISIKYSDFVKKTLHNSGLFLKDFRHVQIPSSNLIGSYLPPSGISLFVYYVSKKKLELQDVRVGVVITNPAQIRAAAAPAMRLILSKL